MLREIQRSLMTVCSEATAILVPVTKRGVFKRGILKSLVSHVLNLKSWSNSFVTQQVYVILSQISLIQLFKFKTWETRLFKMPRLGLPRFQTRRQVRVAFGQCWCVCSRNQTSIGIEFFSEKLTTQNLCVQLLAAGVDRAK